MPNAELIVNVQKQEIYEKGVMIGSVGGTFGFRGPPTTVYEIIPQLYVDGIKTFGKLHSSQLKPAQELSKSDLEDYVRQEVEKALGDGVLIGDEMFIPYNMINISIEYNN